MRTREEMREERREYESDVAYEVWRNGGDMDRINIDRIEDHFYNDHGVGYATRDELRHQKDAWHGEVKIFWVEKNGTAKVRQVK